VLARLPRGALIFGSGVDAYPDVFVRGEKAVAELALQVGPAELSIGEARQVAVLGRRVLRETGGVPPMELSARYYRLTEAEEKLID
jgi:hypothetical protein